MAFVPAPNIVQVEIRATKEGQKIENRLMVDMLATPTEEMITPMLAAVWAAIEETWLDDLPAQVSINQLVGTDMGDAEGVQVTYTEGTLVGTDASGALPGNVSFCVKLGTASRGRSARGRLYWLGLAKDMVTQSDIGATRAGNIATAVDTVIAAIQGESRVPVIVSYVSDGAPRPGGPVYFPITTVSYTDTITDSQRRRLPGRGE